MNAKQINELLTAKGGYKKLNDHERNEVVEFVLRSTPITTEEAAKNLLNGGMIIKVYKQFLNTVEKKFNPSQRRMIIMALEPIYGKIEEKGGEKEIDKKEKEGGKCSSEEFYQAFKRMTPFVRNACMEGIKRDNPQLYKELSSEINLQRRYKGEIKPHFNQNLNNSISHIKVKNGDGSYTYY